MIIHLDADAFFASVEQAADPRLRGKAIAVGGMKRGIIASASYEARKQGVYTPMPTARALKICPRLIVLPGDFDRYEHFSKMMFSYAYDYTADVEVGGIDEGYYDVGANRKLTAFSIATSVRQAIRDTLKIPVSEGIGSNKLVSQIASKLKKPDCFIEVAPGTEREFLAPLESNWLPGVGPSMAKLLRNAGLTRIGQLALVRPDELSLFVGSSARTLYEMAQGIDNRPVIREEPAAKSYGEQETFETDVTDEAYLQAKLRSIADRLMTKVRADHKSVRTFTVKVRYNDMEEEQRSESVQEPTNYEGDIYSLIGMLLKKAWSRRVSVRLISLRFSNLYDAMFAGDLDLDTFTSEKKQKIASVIDAVRMEFGPKALMRGHDLWLQKVKGPRPETTRVRRVITPVEPASRFLMLNCKSYYSFMDSLLSPKDVVALAVQHGASAVAITDPNLHGAMPFYIAAKEAGIRPIIAAEVRSKEGSRFNAYVENATGYTQLCSWLSGPAPSASQLNEPEQGLIIVPTEREDVVGPVIRYTDPGHQYVYQILSSIRTLTLFSETHPEKRMGTFHCRPISNAHQQLTDTILERCRFEFELGGLKFPHYHPSDGSDPKSYLRRLATEGARKRYGARYDSIRPQLKEELAIIAEVGYEEYFLITWELLQECKKRGIDWLTRGSAADSVVCYCLGISSVCPLRFELYFRRFLNRDRMVLHKLPDIDIDFPHDRKDEVIQMILDKYGPEHAAVVGGFNTFQGKSALADIAKVMGVSEFQIRRLTEKIPHVWGKDIQTAVETSVECRNLVLTDDPYKTALALAAKLDGFPRYPKMHPCGMVVSRVPLHTLTPTFQSGKGWPTTHFDMDAVEEVGLVKMDILAQAGLAVMRDTLKLLHDKGITLDLKQLEPWDDSRIWEMIASGHSRGVHHIESPAMLSLERMCNVDNIDDLVAIVSVIRPGAANSLKKVSFSRRCQGLEPAQYPHPSLEPCLRSTYGVIAYEEHILQICEAFAGLPAGRADILRRALVKQNQKKIEELRGEFWMAAESLGHTQDDIQKVWELVSGFQGYAFCRAHSTVYGVEAYEAAHLKLYHPKEFLCCVLEHGKGFYNRLVYSLECRRLGIGLLPPDVNRSRACYYPEEEGIRVPLKQVLGLSETTLARWELGKPFSSLSDFYQRTQPSRDEMNALLQAGAFDSFSDSRTALFWEWSRAAQWPCEKGQGVLFGGRPTSMVPYVPRTEPSRLEKLKAEMQFLGFTATAHTLDLYPDVAWSTYCPIAELGKYPDARVTICGLIIEDRIHYQVDGRPMKFISVCDYSGIIECELFADAYGRYGIETVRHPVVEVTGTVQHFDNKKSYSLTVESAFPPRKNS